VKLIISIGGGIVISIYVNPGSTGNSIDCFECWHEKLLEDPEAPVHCDPEFDRQSALF